MRLRKWIAYLMVCFVLEMCVGTVENLEPTYMPDRVSFWMNCETSGCPAGSISSWISPNKDNVKAVYSTLLAAVISGRKVRVYYNEGTCTGNYLHLLSQ
jgi:hypothetical protein